MSPSDVPLSKMGECERGPAERSGSGSFLIMNAIAGWGNAGQSRFSNRVCRMVPGLWSFLPASAGQAPAWRFFKKLASTKFSATTLPPFGIHTAGQNGIAANTVDGLQKRIGRSLPPPAFQDGDPVRRFHFKARSVSPFPKGIPVFFRPERRKSFRLFLRSVFFRTFFRFFLYFYHFAI